MYKPGLLLITACFSLTCLAQSSAKDSLLKLLGQAKEDTNKVMLYFEAGASVIYQDPLSAMPYFRQGARLAHKLEYYNGLERNYTGLSLSNALLARYDSNYLFADTAVFYAEKAGSAARLSLAYLNRADVKSNLGMFNEALHDCDTALKYAEISDSKDRIGRIYLIFSSIYDNQERFEKASEYLDKALQLHRETKNTQMEAQTFFYKAQISNKLKQFTEARKQIELAIHLADSIGDIQNFPGYYNVYANTLNELNQSELALQMAQKGISYAKQLNNKPNEAVLQIVLLEIFEKMGRYAEAQTAGENAFKTFREVKMKDREELAAHSLSGLLARAGKYKEAYEYLNISRQLADTLLKAKFDKESANLLTSFQIEEKNKEIQLLSKDKLLKEQEINKRNILMAGSILLFMLSLGGIFLIVNRNRLRHRIREMQLRNEIAADLHDEVGSSLSSIRMLSEMAISKQDGGQKEILNRVSSYTKETMEKMGDIVWMIKPSEEEASTLKERMRSFVNELCEGRNIECRFNCDVLDEIKLNMNSRKALYLVFKEAVNNSLKYSGATELEINARRDAGNVYLTVKDNGKGFEVDRSSGGNGLGNMQKRALEQKGQLAIQSAPGKGTTISFMMPW